MSPPSPGPPGACTTVYTDGACRGNPGPGGWAWAVPGGPYGSGADPATTNQRMEIQAALEAVTALSGPVEVVSDSTYVVNCFRDRWWEGWVRRDWTNSQRKPVANADLWKPLIAEYRRDPARIRFRWVKGHSSDPYNDLVDRLAVEAATQQVGRQGTGQPDNLAGVDAMSRAARKAARQVDAGDNRAAPGGAGPPAAPGAAAGVRPGSDGRVPDGHRLAVTGLRPPGLGGYDDNDIAGGTRAKLAEILAAQAQLHPDLVVLTGLGLGAETLGAEAAASAGVPYVAVLPYPDVDRPWPTETRGHFADLLAGARHVVTLQAEAPTSKQHAGQALARRDAWLARHSAQAIVVWDEKDAAVGRTFRSFRDHLGDDVWLLGPTRG